MTPVPQATAHRYSTVACPPRWPTTGTPTLLSNFRNRACRPAQDTCAGGDAAEGTLHEVAALTTRSWSTRRVAEVVGFGVHRAACRPQIAIGGCACVSIRLGWSA